MKGGIRIYSDDRKEFITVTSTEGIVAKKITGKLILSEEPLVITDEMKEQLASMKIPPIKRVIVGEPATSFYALDEPVGKEPANYIQSWYENRRD